MSPTMLTTCVPNQRLGDTERALAQPRARDGGGDGDDTSSCDGDDSARPNRGGGPDARAVRQAALDFFVSIFGDYGSFIVTEVCACVCVCARVCVSLCWCR